MSAATGVRVIELTEWEPQLLPREFMTVEQGDRLRQAHENELRVEFPTPLTDNQWRLTGQNWVGNFTFEDLEIRLLPKVPIHNLFGMLNYAYELDAFRRLEGMPRVDSLDEFLDELARKLALGALTRARRGLARQYVGYDERLPYLRGSVAWRELIRRPATVRLPCSYEDLTPDYMDNRILTWTLFRVARSGRCSARTQPLIRQAFRTLAGASPPLPVKSQDCVDRAYDRLNEDYRILHYICRFFLDGLGARHAEGHRDFVPFLISMPDVFEQFVAKWLEQHLPDRLFLKPQHKISIDRGLGLFFQPDLVVWDLEAGRAVMVLDTKYKGAEKPGTDDISQVVAYAGALRCEEAVLVYPSLKTVMLDQRVGQVRVRALPFDTDQDLDVGGQRFLVTLGV